MLLCFPVFKKLIFSWPDLYSTKGCHMKNNLKETNDKSTRGSFSAVANPVGQGLRGFLCVAIHGL